MGFYTFYLPESAPPLMLTHALTQYSYFTSKDCIWAIDVSFPNNIFYQPPRKVVKWQTSFSAFRTFVLCLSSALVTHRAATICTHVHRAFDRGCSAYRAFHKIPKKAGTGHVWDTHLQWVGQLRSISCTNVCLYADRISWFVWSFGRVYFWKLATRVVVDWRVHSTFPESSRHYLQPLSWPV